MATRRQLGKPLPQLPSARQVLCGVTGVTEWACGVRELTPVLQQVNLICAIAPPIQGPGRLPEWAIPGRPAQPFQPPHNVAPRRVTGESPSPPSTPADLGGPRQTPQAGHKKIALDPAESSAIDDAPMCRAGVGLLGQAPVVWSHGRDSDWGAGKCPVKRLFRPRCAAAGCPPEARGPPLRGSADALRACGWT